MKISQYLFVLLAVFLLSSCGGGENTIDINGTKRSYIVHAPSGIDKDNPAPLLIVLHRFGGDAALAKKVFRLDKLADRDKVIVAYPEGDKGMWNIAGINSDAKTNDVEFIDRMISKLKEKYPIDPNQTCLFGRSEGGMMVYQLLSKSKHTFKAAAASNANVPKQMGFTLKSPVSFLLMNGTEDPLVPYEGGALGNNLGECLSTDASMSIFARTAGCDRPTQTRILNSNKEDGVTCLEFACANCKDNQKVTLIKAEGGGHAHPGAKQYKPVAEIGKVSQDFKTGKFIWGFFGF